MPEPLGADGPVAIGGVGGSGTRVIAAMVSSLGFQAGTDLNRPEDDLTFSILFKRPRLYRDVRGLVPADHPAAVAASRAFVALRSGAARVSPAMWPLVSACAAFPFNGPYPMPPKPTEWAAKRFRAALRHTKPSQPDLWMWKEPNTLLFLPTLYREIPRLRYIHMVRNGLSMAKSRNNFQLTNWGYLFGVAVPPGDQELQKLIYWARINLAVSDFLADQPRSLVVTHERTVADPEGVLDDIATFLGRTVTDGAREVASLVRRPDDFDRSYPFEDDATDSVGSADIRRALERFGYRGTSG